MRTSLPSFSLLLVSFVILAGCAGQDAGKPAATGSDSFVVAGKVIDDQQLPIYDAHVSLNQRKDNALVKSTNATEGGDFNLGPVPVGTYVLVVQSPRFEILTRNVDVIQGRETQLASMLLVMTALPVVEPYYETIPKTLSVQYGIAYQINGDFNQGCMYPAFSCNAFAYPPPNTFFEARDPKGTPWQAVVFEEFWTSTSPLCAKALAVDIYNPDAPSTVDPNKSNPHYWTNYPSDKWKLTSPIRIVIPRNDTNDPESLDADWRVEANGGKMLARGNWTVRNFPPGKGLTNQIADLNCVTDQRFELFWTNFYLEGPKPDFSARPN